MHSVVAASELLVAAAARAFSVTSILPVYGVRQWTWARGWTLSPSISVGGMITSATKSCLHTTDVSPPPASVAGVTPRASNPNTIDTHLYEETPRRLPPRTGRGPRLRPAPALDPNLVHYKRTPRGGVSQSQLRTLFGTDRSFPARSAYIREITSEFRYLVLKNAVGAPIIPHDSGQITGTALHQQTKGLTP